MNIPNSINDTWMMANVRASMDSMTDLAGNSHSPDTVLATIYFCMSALGLSADLNDPTRQEIIAWMNENNLAHEVEYLMEEY